MATFLDSLTLQAQSHAAKVAAGEDVIEYEAFHNEFHALQSKLHGMDCVELHAKVKELGVPASFAESKHELVDVIIDHVHAGNEHFVQAARRAWHTVHDHLTRLKLDALIAHAAEAGVATEKLDDAHIAELCRTDGPHESDPEAAVASLIMQARWPRNPKSAPEESIAAQSDAASDTAGGSVNEEESGGTEEEFDLLEYTWEEAGPLGLGVVARGDDDDAPEGSMLLSIPGPPFPKGITAGMRLQRINAKIEEAEEEPGEIATAHQPAPAMAPPVPPAVHRQSIGNEVRGDPGSTSVSPPPRIQVNPVRMDRTLEYKDFAESDDLDGLDADGEDDAEATGGWARASASQKVARMAEKKAARNGSGWDKRHLLARGGKAHEGSRPRSKNFGAPGRAENSPVCAAPGLSLASQLEQVRAGLNAEAKSSGWSKRLLAAKIEEAEEELEELSSMEGEEGFEEVPNGKEEDPKARRAWAHAKGRGLAAGLAEKAAALEAEARRAGWGKAMLRDKLNAAQEVDRSRNAEPGFETESDSEARVADLEAQLAEKDATIASLERKLSVCDEVKVAQLEQCVFELERDLLEASTAREGARIRNLEAPGLPRELQRPPPEEVAVAALDLPPPIIEPAPGVVVTSLEDLMAALARLKGVCEESMQQNTNLRLSIWHTSMVHDRAARLVHQLHEEELSTLQQAVFVRQLQKIRKQMDQKHLVGLLRNKQANRLKEKTRDAMEGASRLAREREVRETSAVRCFRNATWNIVRGVWCRALRQWQGNYLRDAQRKQADKMRGPLQQFQAALLSTQQSNAEATEARLQVQETQARLELQSEATEKMQAELDRAHTYNVFLYEQAGSHAVDWVHPDVHRDAIADLDGQLAQSLLEKEELAQENATYEELLGYIKATEQERAAELQAEIESAARLVEEARHAKEVYEVNQLLASVDARRKRGEEDAVSVRQLLLREHPCTDARVVDGGRRPLQESRNVLGVPEEVKDRFAPIVSMINSANSVEQMASELERSLQEAREAQERYEVEQLLKADYARQNIPAPSITAANFLARVHYTEANPGTPTATRNHSRGACTPSAASFVTSRSAVKPLVFSEKPLDEVDQIFAAVDARRRREQLDATRAEGRAEIEATQDKLRGFAEVAGQEEIAEMRHAAQERHEEEVAEQVAQMLWAEREATPVPPAEALDGTLGLETAIEDAADQLIQRNAALVSSMPEQMTPAEAATSELLVHNAMLSKRLGIENAVAEGQAATARDAIVSAGAVAASVPASQMPRFKLAEREFQRGSGRNGGRRGSVLSRGSSQGSSGAGTPPSTRGRNRN